ncbi:hypothetical protein FRC03_011344 [Tulasnella sp. 419]|nr:hypothetical protein FRC03_011344 [Tulasnella sp. 419]
MAITNDDKARLITAASEARGASYSPYSRFRVGASLLSADGQIIKGTNVENASIGGSICAEQSAIASAASEGIRKFTALAVTTDVPEALSPCGTCRQVLREFCPLEMPIFLVPANFTIDSDGTTSGGSIKEVTLRELLPLSFGPEDLEKNPRKD